MPGRDELLPAPMRRTAIVAPDNRSRRVMIEVADAGLFEPDPASAIKAGPIRTLADQTAIEHRDVVARLSVGIANPDELASTGQIDLLLGEASLEQHSAAALHVGRCTVLPGWTAGQQVESLRERVAPFGGSVVELPGRRGLVPPTAHADNTVSNSFRPLVTTYATVPYRDLDPTLFAAIAYMLMFGMMFGDVAHGLAIVALGVAARSAPHGRLGVLKPMSAFLIGAGLAATAFGFLYGEAFGPTGLVPALWLRPLDEPETLLAAGVVFGVFLLAITFVMATVNRWREAGPAVALYDPSGIGGALVLVGTAAIVVGVVDPASWLSQVGLWFVVAGATLIFVGLFVKAGAGASGFAQSLVELFDSLLRLGSNIVSFARLAAFGLTHAVITAVVWEGTVALWDVATPAAIAAAIALFAIGNLVAFALGALVAAVQALRLEYYELFSRLFVSQGRPFDPWHVPTQRLEIS